MKKPIFLCFLGVIALLFAGLFLSGCPEPELPVTYTLTVTVDPADSGTITAVPAVSDTAAYDEGETVILSAVPASGYAFSSWSVDDVTTGGGYGMIAVAMDADKAVTASFTAIPAATYSLTVSVSPVGSGTVTRSPDATSYVYGTVVTLTASPASGYAFSEWSGDATGSTSSKTITMDGNKSVTAGFLPQNPGGSIQEGALSLSGTVTTLSGSPDVSGYHYDGTGVGALFHYPRGTVLIGSYLYIADSNNHRIRRLNVTTGTAETFSGNGTAGNIDGTWDTARFNSPCGITTDGTTYLYVTCESSHTVRRVSLADGSVETIAGIAGTTGSTDNATGTSATFYSPAGIAFVAGSPDSLYVCDRYNYTVRNIALTGTFAVTTYAGEAGTQGSTDDSGTAARFRDLDGIVSDGTYLWVSDSSAHTIRRIVISTAAVTTVAGTYQNNGLVDAVGAAARFNYPAELAVSGATLYISDTNNNAIRVMNTSTYSVTTLTGTAGYGSVDGGPSVARFSYPHGLALSGTTLYVMDQYNQTVRRVNTSTRITSTVTGSAGCSGFWNGTGSGALFRGPSGITTDGDYLYVTENEHTIRKIEPATGAAETLAGSANNNGSSDGVGTSARFYNPRGITISGGYLYVCDGSNHTIRRVDKETGETITFAGLAGTGESLDGTGTGARFYYPNGITTDGANLYVTDGHYTIRKIVISTQAVTTIAGTSGVSGNTDSQIGLEARFNDPYGITTDGQNLYVCDSSGYVIRVVDLSGTTYAVSTLAGWKGTSGYADGVGTAARFRNPMYITCDGAYLYVTDSAGGHTVRRIGISSREVDTVAGLDATADWVDGTGTSARFDTPYGITANDTCLYVCDLYNYVIRKIE